MKKPIDCHQCKNKCDDLINFDSKCKLTKESVLDYTDKRHPKCPLK